VLARRSDGLCSAALYAPQIMPEFLLNPSRLARYFYHECDRYLRYHATPKGRREADGVPPLPEQTAVTEALLEGGYEWEETVAKRLLEGLVRVGPGPGPLRDRIHTPASTLRLLDTLEPGEAIYQATLEAPASFLGRYAIDPALAGFMPCRPDLIVRVDARRRGRPLLRVVDVKANDELKASHRVQVALYAWILRDVVAEAGLQVDVDVEEGGVWLFGAPAPEWFPLGAVSGVLERFLRERLPGVLGGRREDVPWHLFFRCEWCEFYAHCRAEAEQTRSVSLVPYLSVKARAYLREAPWGGEPVNTLGELSALAQAPDAEQRLEGCGSLRGRAGRLARAAQAIEQGVVVPHGGSTVAMPAREGVRIVLTLQRDPISGRVYAAGFARAMGREVYGTGSDAQVFVAPTLDACADVRRDFLRALFGALSRLHRFNELQPAGARKSLQTYVFDGYERELFEAMLLESLADPSLAEAALPLFLHYHGAGGARREGGAKGEGGARGEGEARGEARPDGGTEVPYPVVVITRVLRELFAMPSPVSISLEGASAALPQPGYPYTYRPAHGMAFSLSNALRSDAIFHAWYRGESVGVERVRGELRNRLLAASAVVDGLRARAGGSLFAWPPRFELQAPHAFRRPALGRLAFLVRHERFREALAMRELRGLPWEERVRGSVVVRLVSEGGGRFAVEGEVEPSALEVDAGYPGHLVVPDTPEGERAQLSFDDHRHRAAFWLGGGGAGRAGLVRLASVEGVELDAGTGRCARATVVVRGGKDQPPLPAGERLLLYPRFTDFTSDRVVQRLEALDDAEEGDFARLLHDPASFDAPLREGSTGRAAALALLPRARFTPSQRAAFARALSRRLLLVWGPPGTGKTYFLARAVGLLAAARRAAGQPLRVCVTAFTHAAIENLLDATSVAAGELGVELPVAKLGELRGAQGGHRGGGQLSAISTARAARGAPGDVSVLGATVYELRRAAEQGLPPCDLLVVDEASQLRLGELSLATLVLGERARLVLAGDDLQLPPLVKGRPPPPLPGERDLMVSAFAYLRAAGGDASTRQLTENFRMNETLCCFSAETLYGDAYRPATRAVARRKLSLASPPARPARGEAGLAGPPTIGDPSSPGELARWALDPAFPLVICMLEGPRAAGENRQEARLVAALSGALRDRLLSGGERYPDTAEGDARFWREALLIVGPHHEQNRAVRAALTRERRWLSPPVVETVEKVQGQEAECVLVSYGVSDPETALAEGEFLYSRNRLNVAVSRARSKCVVFLPRPLLDASFEVIRSDAIAEGLAHMHALLGFCRARGSERVFPVAGGGRLVAVRARVPAALGLFPVRRSARGSAGERGWWRAGRCPCTRVGAPPHVVRRGLCPQHPRRGAAPAPRPREKGLAAPSLLAISHPGFVHHARRFARPHAPWEAPCSRTRPTACAPFAALQLHT
jgi:DNA replication ATP-dependent helicase Dna2